MDMSKKGGAKGRAWGGGLMERKVGIYESETFTTPFLSSTFTVRC